VSKKINHSIRAVVLLSGGLDSATALAWALKQGWDCTSLSFNYGQRHDVELQAAVNIAKTYGVTDHRVIDVSLGVIGGSALTSTWDVPKDLPESSDIPITYVPARNLIFLSLAAGLAETVGALKIVIGANVVDYSGYPDCRPDFLSAFERVANLGTKAGDEGQRFEVVAPLIALNKSEIIRLGLSLGVDYGLTRSCYDPDAEGRPCGHCDSCRYRKVGFEMIGEKDPLNYQD